MDKRRQGLLAGLLAAGLGVGGAVADGNKLVLDGSTTVGPIAKAFAEYYMAKNPDVNVTVNESGSGNGAKSLINDIYPNAQTVTSGRYPIARPLFMFTNGYPKLGSHEHAFVTLYLSEKGQEIIEDIGFVPVTQY